MNTELEKSEVIEAEPNLVPSEPPVFLEEELLLDVDEWLNTEEKDIQPHGLDEYCEYSRRLRNQQEVRRPTYIGYPMVPKSPLGVCH